MLCLHGVHPIALCTTLQMHQTRTTDHDTHVTHPLISLLCPNYLRNTNQGLLHDGMKVLEVTGPGGSADRDPIVTTENLGGLILVVCVVWEWGLFVWHVF